MPQTIAVKLFAAARQTAGRDSIAVELPVPATVADLRQAIAVQFPPLAGILRHAHIAVDNDYATDATLVSAQSEIALIPPVSGG